MNIYKVLHDGLIDAEIWEDMQLQYQTHYGLKYTIPANHGFSKEICMPEVRL